MMKLRTCLLAAVVAIGVGASAIPVAADTAVAVPAKVAGYCAQIRGMVVEPPPYGACVWQGDHYAWVRDPRCDNYWFRIEHKFDVCKPYTTIYSGIRRDDAPSPVQDPFRCDDNARRDGGPCVAVGLPPVPSFGIHRAVTAAPRDLDCSYWDIINWQCGWREGYTGFLGGRPPRILVHAVPMFVRSWLGLWWGPVYGSWTRFGTFAWER